MTDRTYRHKPALSEMVALPSLADDQNGPMKAGEEIALYPGNVQWMKGNGMAGLPIHHAMEMDPDAKDDEAAG